jgi:2-polyprenyl-3-methyl-5-hydroxy-6-metoxy-1,4-benzoquinol methylase
MIRCQFKRLLKLVFKQLKLSSRDVLFFPTTFKNKFPPPQLKEPYAAWERPLGSIDGQSEKETYATWEKPLSPIDGRPVERFLFTSPDTRFGHVDLNYIYLDTRNKIAVTYPPISADTLDNLYRENYSTCSTEIKFPTVNFSPYQDYFGGTYWEKILFYLPIEIVGRVFRLTRRSTFHEIKKMLIDSRVNINKALRFLDVGCFEGALLDQLSKQTSWQLFGLEPNEAAVKIVQMKGYHVWHGHAENAIEKIKNGLQFDVIHMGQSIEHIDHPVQVLCRLRLLLAPGGVLILSTPNLSSKQIEWFGPTWSHWHPPYHRYIFSEQGLVALAKQVGLSIKNYRTYSHFYWTAMSIVQNRLGLMGSVSHNVSFDKGTLRKALRLVTWSWLFWDWREQGDYAYIVLHEGEKHSILS